MTAAANIDDRHGVADTFPIDFLRDIVRVFARRDIDIDQQLRSAGISPTLLHDDRARTTIDQASRLIQGLWRTTDDELFGLGSQPMPRGTFRMMAIGLVHTPDLGGALERWSEFSGLLPGLPKLTVTNAGESVRLALDLRTAGMADPLAAGLALAVLQRFASWLISRRIDAKLVELPYPKPRDTSSVDLVFAAPIGFDADEPGLLIDSRLLNAPVMQNEETLETYLASCPRVWLTRRDFGTTLADRVRRVLSRGLMSDWPDQDEIAERMAMSTQTLRRRLREQDTSVTRIKEEIQRDAAVASLVAGQESVAALAQRLGFSEPSAFHRAFRRWTGQAPGAYRSSAAAS